MEQNFFYRHVSKWIRSYYNADALEWLHRFINNSNEPAEVKVRLHREVDRKIASLRNMPYFSLHDDMQLLMDKEGYPMIFTTRYAAMNKLAELTVMGYDVRLLEGNAFYRIQLIQPAPINHVPLTAEGLRISA